jgi:hypothetical protein
MSNAAFDIDSRTRPTTGRIARKVWREVARPFRRRLKPAFPVVQTIESVAQTGGDADAALLGYLRAAVLPRPADVHDNYVPSHWLGTHGIDLRESDQLTRIERWRGNLYQKLYLQLRNDAEVNCPLAGKSYLGTTCLHNGWYPTPDAEIYASMICDFRPDKIVEIGSGFSTLIARRALDYAHHDAPLVVIDPAPRTDVEQAADSVVYQRVEDC